ncbi:putative rad21/Rec8-like protein [Helianthus annuus]|uniref:Rad21/Rec8-like protein n=1 Tax=Helianthus annuus TaxID=4232 RepID=A0A9K3IDP8_HELAN|nr:putative rad21/Rec8-like protein [Helianthus annuus]KAJ0546473.1 putative rad21/Rec8-like protein [Helianthus annuus]KAJ0722104.1 putative rad21/Rec8-like protein [Helianthus annuus]
MFYSHQLLARKAPLGQICEEILNPSVPMALRLSGILMGNFVIPYQYIFHRICYNRNSNWNWNLFFSILLYANLRWRCHCIRAEKDVTRLLVRSQIPYTLCYCVEINEAWRVKAKRDPTVLPKGKSQAKYEDVTLPANQPADLGDLEQHLQFSNSDTLMGMHKSAYIDMNLDNIDDSYISHNQGDADLPHDHHQADIENITLFDRFDSHQTDAGRFKQFERFDIEGDDINGDDVTLEKDPSYNHSLDLPNTLIPSPPLQDEPKKRKFQLIFLLDSY